MKKIIQKIKCWYQNLQKIEKEKNLEEYYKKEYKNKSKLIIKPNIKIESVKHLIYLPQDAIIEYKTGRLYNFIDERENLNKLTAIFKILEKHNRTYNFHITVENREVLKQSDALEHTKNINLTIHNDGYNYSKEEYLQEEQLLEEMISPIKKANLSPYEKYLAVYNIVKQFKEYKENYLNKEESRCLRYILNNDYMVCVGYANLLTTLLDKVGIPSQIESVQILTSLPNPFPIDDNTLSFQKYQGHQRNIVKIDDDKYSIHGIYIADATADNNIKLDLYSNASITFDKNKEAEEPEKLSRFDLLLDFHNFDEYCNKINFYLKRKYNENSKINSNEKIIYSYQILYNEIMQILYNLDYSKWKELYLKYQNELKENDHNYKDHQITLFEYELLYSKFLTEYGHYIIQLSNNKIEYDTLYNAAERVKEKIYGYNQEELKEWKENTQLINKPFDINNYPYIYNPDNIRPHYLEEKPESLLRVRKKLF